MVSYSKGIICTYFLVIRNYVLSLFVFWCGFCFCLFVAVVVCLLLTPFKTLLQFFSCEVTMEVIKSRGSQNIILVNWTSFYNYTDNYTVGSKHVCSILFCLYYAALFCLVCCFISIF